MARRDQESGYEEHSESDNDYLLNLELQQERQRRLRGSRKDTKIADFKQLILRLADDLSKKDMEKITFYAEVKEKSPLKLLGHLQQSGKISADNIDPLEEILKGVHLCDLITKHIQPYKEKYDKKMKPFPCGQSAAGFGNRVQSLSEMHSGIQNSPIKDSQQQQLSSNDHSLLCPLSAAVGTSPVPSSGFDSSSNGGRPAVNPHTKRRLSMSSLSTTHNSPIPIAQRDRNRRRSKQMCGTNPMVIPNIQPPVQTQKHHTTSNHTQCQKKYTTNGFRTNKPFSLTEGTLKSTMLQSPSAEDDQSSTYTSLPATFNSYPGTCCAVVDPRRLHERTEGYISSSELQSTPVTESFPPSQPHFSSLRNNQQGINDQQKYLFSPGISETNETNLTSIAQEPSSSNSDQEGEQSTSSSDQTVTASGENLRAASVSSSTDLAHPEQEVSNSYDATTLSQLPGSYRTPSELMSEHPSVASEDVFNFENGTIDSRPLSRDSMRSPHSDMPYPLDRRHSVDHCTETAHCSDRQHEATHLLHNRRRTLNGLEDSLSSTCTRLIPNRSSTSAGANSLAGSSRAVYEQECSTRNDDTALQQTGSLQQSKSQADVQHTKVDTDSSKPKETMKLYSFTVETSKLLNLIKKRKYGKSAKDVSFTLHANSKSKSYPKVLLKVIPAAIRDSRSVSLEANFVIPKNYSRHKWIVDYCQCSVKLEVEVTSEHDHKEVCPLTTNETKIPMSESNYYRDIIVSLTFNKLFSHDWLLYEDKLQFRIKIWLLEHYFMSDQTAHQFVLEDRQDGFVNITSST